MTHQDLLAALSEIYAMPTWALFKEVGSGVGRSYRRSADALAMGMWQSRGIELYGFEIKTDRRDWLRELKEPAKADEICRYCDRWWIVASDRDIVKEGELPPTWGLMAPSKGGKLYIFQSAPLLKAQPWTRTFLAAILRRAAEQSAETKALETKYREGHDAGFKEAESLRSYEKTRLKEIEEHVATFERASGISIRDVGYRGSNYCREIGAAAKVIMEIDRGKLVESLEHARNLLKARVRDLDAGITELAATDLPTITARPESHLEIAETEEKSS